MENRGYHTHKEILSQPEAWAAALDVLRGQQQSIRSFWQSNAYEQVIFTGCGSTYYLAYATASLFQEQSGIPARGLPASELWLYPEASYPQKGRVLLVAVSRSGETSETLRACETFKASNRGDIVTLSCYNEFPLATMGKLNLVFPSGAEKSVAQTRAFSTLYLSAVALAQIWTGNDKNLDALAKLSEAGQRVLEKSAPLAQKIGPDMEIDRFYFLGSGPRYGLACELSLKMKEMTLSHSEPFHFMEFRHGPKSMVTPSTLIMGLLSDANHTQEAAVLNELRDMGGRILEIGENGRDVAFQSGLDERLRNILYLPVGQLVAYERSMAKGLNPDHPSNLDFVVKL
jgi:glucosamine--fructose-6-phosphate aminotransferase (isomerizing)